MLIVTKYASNQEKAGNNNQKISTLTGMLSLLLFNVMTFYFLYADFNKVKNLNSIPIDLSQLIFILLGVIMMILGNIMPKVKMNSMIGLRTTWSMKNEITWKKSQKFGGISFIIVGILIIITNLFTKAPISIFLSLAILILSLPFDIYYTYEVAKKYN